jgi:hypothetical protein
MMLLCLSAAVGADTDTMGEVPRGSALFPRAGTGSRDPSGHGRCQDGRTSFEHYLRDVTPVVLGP